MVDCCVVESQGNITVEAWASSIFLVLPIHLLHASIYHSQMLHNIRDQLSHHLSCCTLVFLQSQLYPSHHFPCVQLQGINDLVFNPWYKPYKSPQEVNFVMSTSGREEKHLQVVDDQ